MKPRSVREHKNRAIKLATLVVVAVTAVKVPGLRRLKEIR